MPKCVTLIATILLVITAMVGCGGQKPAQTEKPAEPAFTAQIKNIDAMPVASISRMGPYSGAGEVVKTLMAWVTQAKVQPAGAPFGVYLDDPTAVKPESLRYEVGIAVPAGTKVDKNAGVEVKPMGPMTVAATMHVGAYDKVSETYAKLAKWVADNKYIVAGPGIEFYLSPENTPIESLKTEVCLVIALVQDSTGTSSTGEKKGLPPSNKK